MKSQQSSTLQNWVFSFSEGSLSPSALIEQMAQKCKLFRPPTIIFGDNTMTIKDSKNDFFMTYNALQALKYLNHEYRKQKYYHPHEQAKQQGISYIPGKLQIKHAQKWKHIQAPKDIEISEVQEISDSFFITPFKGRIQGKYKIQKSSQNVIPLHKLGQENKIIFYKQGSIYEDELDDNGLIQYEYKFRSMASSWFGLIRCYVRVDDVIVMILDTRLYWEEGWDKVARQFMVKQCKWEDLKNKGFQTVGGWTTNPHQSHMVYEHLDEKFVENQYIMISP